MFNKQWSSDFSFIPSLELGQQFVNTVNVKKIQKWMVYNRNYTYKNGLLYVLTSI